MSAYRYFYDTVVEKLETLTTIKTIEDYNEQYENSDQYNLIKYPAVFVESGDVEWDKNQNSFYDYASEPQTGIATIKIHVVYHTLKSFDRPTKDIFYSIVDTVSSCLQKLKGQPTEIGTFSTLLRTREEYRSDNKQLRVAILTFETQLTDVFLDNNKVEQAITFTIAQVVEDLSFGALKDINGNILTDNNNDILYDENGKIIIKTQKYL